MGFDLYGLKPNGQNGEYFRNNVWWWRPLWDYVVDIVDLKGEAKKGESNSCYRLSDKKAKKIAEILKREIKEGNTREYEYRYWSKLVKMPDIKCKLCKGTGKRKDMPDQDKCNACNGLGHERPFETHYPFSEENVKEFAIFCEKSGGFEIC